MKKIIFLALASIILTVNFSCKKDDATTGNSISSPFTVKYEIITSKPAISTPPGTFTTSIMYVNSTGQVEQSSTLMIGTNWSKTLTITATNRPIPIAFRADFICLSQMGNLTANLYINGELKASVTNPSQNLAPYYVVNGALDFLVN